MKQNSNTSSLTNFTLVDDTIQLKLYFNTEVYIHDDIKLRLVKNMIERINLTELRKVYSSFGRKPTVNPATSYGRYEYNDVSPTPSIFLYL